MAIGWIHEISDILSMLKLQTGNSTTQHPQLFMQYTGKYLHSVILGNSEWKRTYAGNSQKPGFYEKSLVLKLDL
jgi:hypothetical protein